MLPRLAILIVSLALLGAACSDSSATTTVPDPTVTTTSDPDALVVFGSWRPGKALIGAILFAAFDAYQVRLQGITCIRLHSSEDGVGIYRKMGFRPDNSEMVLNLIG